MLSVVFFPSISIKNGISRAVRKMQGRVIGNQVVAFMLDDDEVASVSPGQYFFGKDIIWPPLSYDTFIETDHPW
jgi:hypothetical protein